MQRAREVALGFSITIIVSIAVLALAFWFFVSRASADTLHPSQVEAYRKVLAERTQATPVNDTDGLTCIARGELRQLRNGDVALFIHGEQCRSMVYTTEQKKQVAELVGQRVRITTERLAAYQWQVLSIEPIVPKASEPSPVLTVEAVKPVAPSPSDVPIVGGAVVPKVETEE